MQANQGRGGRFGYVRSDRPRVKGRPEARRLSDPRSEKRECDGTLRIVPSRASGAAVHPWHADSTRRELRHPAERRSEPEGRGPVAARGGTVQGCAGPLAGGLGRVRMSTRVRTVVSGSRKELITLPVDFGVSRVCLVRAEGAGLNRTASR